MVDRSEQPFQAPPPPAYAEPLAPRPVKLRPVAIILFVLGLLILLGGIAKFIPGGPGTGGAVAFFGALLFAFSFIRLPEVAADAEPPMTPLQKVASIFYEPSRVFRNLRIHPRWTTAFLIIALLNVVYTNAFMRRLTPERIISHVTEKLAESRFVPPEAVEKAREQQMEQATNPVQRVGTAIKSVVGVFVFIAFVAALYFLVILAFGGKINYWQSLAVTFYATLPVVVIQKLLSLVILYIKDPEDIHPILGQETLVQDNLGVLFTPADHPVLFVAATSIGVLSFYGLWLKARGLYYGGTRVSSTAAWSSAVIIWLLGLTLAMIFTAFFPSFIS